MRLIDLAERVGAIRQTLGLSEADLAFIVDVDPRTVRRWLGNQNFPQGEHEQRLAELYEVSTRVVELFSSPEAAQRWMQQPSRDLAGLQPVEVLRARRLDRVIGALEAIAGGDFT
jgi:putative toxin-antitoxin system antitoxin component (TIGR02293 family)